MGAKVLPEATSSKPNDGQSATGLTATSAGPPSTTDDNLSFGASLRFALPAFATTSLSLLISVYAVDFYSSIGTKIAFLSFFTALARSFDVITDPLMGWLSDRTRGIGRIKGRRRPYLFIGPAFYALAFSLLFYPPPFWPNTPGDGKVCLLLLPWPGLRSGAFAWLSFQYCACKGVGVDCDASNQLFANGRYEHADCHWHKCQL